jgi:hypothetical protein
VNDPVLALFGIDVPRLTKGLALLGQEPEPLIEHPLPRPLRRALGDAVGADDTVAQCLAHSIWARGRVEPTDRAVTHHDPRYRYCSESTARCRRVVKAASRYLGVEIIVDADGTITEGAGLDDSSSERPQLRRHGPSPLALLTDTIAANAPPKLSGAQTTAHAGRHARRFGGPRRLNP